MPVPLETIGPDELEQLAAGRIQAIGSEIGFEHLGFWADVLLDEATEVRSKKGRQGMRARLEISYSYQRRATDPELDRRLAKRASLDIARNLMQPNDAELLSRTQAWHLVSLGPWDDTVDGWILGKVTLLIDHDIDITDPAVGA